MGNWVDSQHTAFVRWCNIQLSPKGSPPIADLARDFSNGVQLCRLTEEVTGQPVGRILENPRYMEYYGNVQLALDLLKYNGVKLDTVGAADIVEGNLKLILGLVWQLILRFAVADISQDGVSAREGLLLWCKFNAAAKGVNVTDFSKSWRDGRALCAIMSVFRPQLLNFESIPNDPLECVELALAAAEKAGIPHLVDAEDIVQGADEKSFILYMAYWFHTFSGNEDPPGRRIQQFCDVFAVPLRMKLEYERRMKALLEAMENQCASWTSANLDSFESILKEFRILKTYKKQVKREWAEEKSALIQLYGNIRIKINMYGGQQYNPSSELSPQYLNAMWLGVLAAENSHCKLITEKLHKLKERLRHEFAETANSTAVQLHAITVEVSALGGELDAQLGEIIQQSDMLKAIKAGLKRLLEIDGRCREIGIEDNDYTVHTYEELEYDYKLAEQTVNNKLAFIENQIVAQKSKIDLELLNEFETSFRYADRSCKNRLNEGEFKMAMISLGCNYTSEEFREIFVTLCDKTTEQVTFHNYIKFLMTLNEPTAQISLQQASKSFREISNGKDFVTRADLEAAMLPSDTITTLMEIMPCKGDGYDYESYLESINA